MDISTVDAEVARLRRLWSGASPAQGDGLADILSAEVADALDPFDRVQLAEVVRVCRNARSLSDAGRTLFSASLARRSSSNDADRLRKYLQRFELSWSGITA